MLNAGVIPFMFYVNAPPELTRRWEKTRELQVAVQSVPYGAGAAALSPPALLFFLPCLVIPVPHSMILCFVFIFAFKLVGFFFGYHSLQISK